MNQNITFTAAFQKKYYKEKYVLDHLKSYNNNIEADWSHFTKLFLIEFKEYVQEEVSQNSARTYCALIRAVLNKYNDAVELPFKEYASILSLKKGAVLNTYLTLNEIQQLLNYKPQNDTEHTVWSEFLLSCFTGMRHSDVVDLTEKNINKSEIVYRAKKTNSIVRTVNNPITEQLIKGKKNIRIAHCTFNQEIKKICMKAGIDSEVQIVWGNKEETGEKYKFISSHDARRSFATNTYEEFKDIKLVCDLMGHSDIKTTQSYICTNSHNIEQVKNMFNKLQYTG